MLKIAHRGASAYAPENTLSAFHKAMEMGADGIELDVHCCKSGELVVIHDDTVERTTGHKGRVAEMTLHALRDGLGVPLLEEVIDALGKGVTYFIECKHADALTPAAHLIEQYLADGWANTFWLITFRHAELKKALAHYRKVHGGATFQHLNEGSAELAKDLHARAILPHFEALTRDYVDGAHALGLKVFTWTVNSQPDIARCRALGVDGIMSDYPDRLITGR